MPGLLVTATDTGVGKTTVACALVRVARARGLDVGAMKPVESGCARAASGELVPADGVLLRAAAGGGDPLELVCPVRLHAPLAPGIAAELEGVDVDPDAIDRAFRELSARHRDGVIAEGAGGLLVPLDPAFTTVADLAVRLGLPVLVVARPGLGTINHTALTVEVLATRGIECRGVIINGSTPEDPAHVRANALAIERLADVPVIAVLPHVPATEPGRREAALADVLSRALGGGGKVDLAQLLA